MSADLAAATFRAVLATIETDSTLAGAFGATAGIRRIFRADTWQEETPMTPYLVIEVRDDDEVTGMSAADHARAFLDIHLYGPREQARNATATGFTNFDSLTKRITTLFNHVTITDANGDYLFAVLKRVSGLRGPTDDPMKLHAIERYRLMARRNY